MRHLLLFSMLLISAIVAGCSGGKGSPSAPSGNGSSQAHQLGERAMPGAAIAVERLQPVVPGTTCTFRVTITGSQVTALSARIGSTYGEGDAVNATPVIGQPDRFDLAMSIPPGLASDARVWASATLADGSVIESGLEDFPLN